ncbi:hypothetical protein TELCIR_25722, partial [Teladorsagia circumcincta]
GSMRELLAEHLWQDTQTLQFDRKKFVIIAVEGSQQTESIFFTDHHTNVYDLAWVPKCVAHFKATF